MRDHSKWLTNSHDNIFLEVDILEIHHQTHRATLPATLGYILKLLLLFIPWITITLLNIPSRIFSESINFTRIMLRAYICSPSHFVQQKKKNKKKHWRTNSCSKPKEFLWMLATDVLYNNSVRSKCKRTGHFWMVIPRSYTQNMFYPSLFFGDSQFGASRRQQLIVEKFETRNDASIWLLFIFVACVLVGNATQSGYRSPFSSCVLFNLKFD